MNQNCKKKINKKLKKHYHTVFKETGILCQQLPSKNMVLCNVGQVNGLTEEILIEKFESYGKIKKVLLIPGKSCCFLSFNDESTATEVMNKCNGILEIAQDNKPVLLSYVENMPIVEEEKLFLLPPGLKIFENFISEEEENQLLSFCKFNEDNSSGVMKHRQVKHYGYEFRYDINNVDKEKPLNEQIPKECDYIIERLEHYGATFKPDQLTINHYSPGQGIPPHIDTHSAFEDPIVILSLGSPVVMEFRKKEQHYFVILPNKSLTILSNESRYCWSHAITPRKFDYYPTNNGFNTIKRGIRVSFTFRKILKDNKCQCHYVEYCDSQLNNNINYQQASELEKLHVHNVYDHIANHFSETRHKPWPNVYKFINSFHLGDFLVDVGCGNGKYLNLNQNIIKIGCDISRNLLDLCKEKQFEIFLANCLKIPLKDNCTDGVLSIAVIHHLANQQRRLEAIQEIIRILKPSGRALIYVWAKDQCRNNEETTYLKQDRKNKKYNHTFTTHLSNDFHLPVHINRTEFKYTDVLVPWKLKNTNKYDEQFLRFYHVFEENELENLCGNFKNIDIIQSYYDQGNWCILFEKKNTIII